MRKEEKIIRDCSVIDNIYLVCICSVTDLSVFVLTATDTTTEKISGSGFHLSLFNETPERKYRWRTRTVGGVS